MRPPPSRARSIATRSASSSVDAAHARAAHNRLLNYHRVTRDSSGTLVKHALSGYDGKGFVLFAMYPKKVHIHRGQKVNWHFSSLRYEDHSVTFPQGKATKVAQNGFAPFCDTGSGPDKPPQVQGPPFCNNPNDLELDIKPRFAFRRGDKRYHGGDYSNSGLQGANFGTAPYTAQVHARRTAKASSTFACSTPS